jgi:hypothetical protein
MGSAPYAPHPFDLCTRHFFTPPMATIFYYIFLLFLPILLPLSPSPCLQSSSTVLSSSFSPSISLLLYPRFLRILLCPLLFTTHLPLLPVSPFLGSEFILAPLPFSHPSFPTSLSIPPPPPPPSQSCSSSPLIYFSPILSFFLKSLQISPSNISHPRFPNHS